MTNILLTFCHLSWQKGSVAQVISFVQEWRHVNGPANFTIVSQYPELDRKMAAELDIRVVGHNTGRWSSPNLQNLRWLGSLLLANWARLLQRIGIPVGLLLRNEVTRAFLETDMVADLSGDSYRDRPGGFSPAHNILSLAVRVLGKPLCLVSQSLGPFHPVNHALTRWALNGTACLYLREASTPRILDHMGAVRAPRVMAPDIAFKLPLPEAEALSALWDRVTAPPPRQPADWVGISTNCLMLDFKGHDGPYVDQMVALIRHIRSANNPNILLVPHVIHHRGLGTDDVEPCRQIAAALGAPPWLRFSEEDMSPIELKGLISKCEVFLAARMHAGIAGLSSSTPTAFLSWSHKYQALLADIGLEKFNWEFGTGTNFELLQMYDELWKNRTEIRDRLRTYNDSAGEKIAAALTLLNQIATSGHRAQPHSTARSISGAKK